MTRAPTRPEPRRRHSLTISGPRGHRAPESVPDAWVHGSGWNSSSVELPAPTVEVLAEGLPLLFGPLHRERPRVIHRGPRTTSAGTRLTRGHGAATPSRGDMGVATVDRMSRRNRSCLSTYGIHGVDANRGSKAWPAMRGSVGSIFSHSNALKTSMNTIGSSGRS